MKEHQHKKVTLAQIQRELLQYFPEVHKLSYITIWRLLRKELRYSYKKASQRPIAASTSENAAHYRETSLILAALRRCEVNICWMDEYNVSEQDMRLYSWIPIGKEDHLYN